MKRFFVFTLMSLFATTSLFLTNGYSYDSDFEYDWLFDDTVYASIYITTDFDNTTEIASAYFSFYISNDGRGDVKMYSTATMELHWNGGSVTPPPKEDTAIVEANSTGSINEDFVFSLRDKEEGPGSMWAEGELDVRHAPTNEKSSVDPPAYATTVFVIR